MGCGEEPEAREAVTGSVGTREDGEVAEEAESGGERHRRRCRCMYMYCC